MAKRNLKLRIECPFEAAMEILGGKWKGMILYQLLDGTKRFNELRAAIPSISQKMLAQQLRELENDKIIFRKIYPQVPPKVEYSLTATGKNLAPIFKQVRDWGKQFV